MKTILTILLVLIAPLAFAAQKSSAKLGYDAAWIYSLTVTDGSGEEYFSLSLMKNGQLGYDYWVDGKPEEEKSIALSDAQLTTLKSKFADAFQSLPKAKDGSGPEFALENIEGRQSTTWTVTGATPQITALLDTAKSHVGGNYPFPVK